MLPFNNQPTVQLVGDVDHLDFRDAIELLRADTQVLAGHAVWPVSPELIVVAQSRPDVTSSAQFNSFHRGAPLAGIVTLLGSWCEGETRTGRPWPAAQRCYWYEFPAWWRRQLALRASGCCPDWARQTNFLPRVGVARHPRTTNGLIVLHTTRSENADALSDVLNLAGLATVWQRTASNRPHVRGPVAGIWDGAQLNGGEETTLSSFCDQLARGGAPVLALLDFPRRDRVDRALQIGATAVIGKPWINSDLVATLDTMTAASQRARAA
jgi:hypothetical protein